MPQDSASLELVLKGFLECVLCTLAKKRQKPQFLGSVTYGHNITHYT